MSQSRTAAHAHVFLGAAHARSERNVWAVIALTGAMMVVEIVGGAMFGSIALVADGFHMSTHAGALLLATHAESQLVYRGRVGTGFSEDSLRHLHRKLAPMRDSQPVFTQAPSVAETRGVHWVRPELLAEVSFAEFTQDGLIRHATFLGLREGKGKPNDVLSNPDLNVCMTGPANAAEMDEALAALDEGPLSPEENERIRRLGKYVYDRALRKG